MITSGCCEICFEFVVGFESQYRVTKSLAVTRLDEKAGSFVYYCFRNTVHICRNDRNGEGHCFEKSYRKPFNKAWQNIYVGDAEKTQNFLSSGTDGAGPDQIK